MKSGGGTQMAAHQLLRSDVEKQLTHELYSRRSESNDLVDVIFGPLMRRKSSGSFSA